MKRTRIRSISARLLCAASILVHTRCAPDSWPVAPAGRLAAGAMQLWWLFAGVGIATWLVMLGVIAWAVAHRRGRATPTDDRDTGRQQKRAVVGATAFTALVLAALALADFLVTRSLGADENVRDALTIEVTGHQWWWELTYEPGDPARRFTTANELHVPVGRPVRLILTSRDVIHSFWVPRLQGKRDLIPGYENTLWIRADEPGIYEGACAEFCGMQHAQMRLSVIADSAERFDAWYDAQREPAVQPATPLALQGRDVFVEKQCGLCHAVRGTAARGTVAPDLTHLASRRTLAAGILPNTRGFLGGWIVDPQQIKPGTRMPRNALAGPELNALLEYLGALR
jgi:cytochrome c oxidase subunit II